MSSAAEDPRRAFAREIVERLRAAGHTAYWAGGCVRDELLGVPPKDYDVATSTTPDEIRAVFGRRRTHAVGAAFGVITVIGSKSQGHVEVATFREDIGYSDGRRPDRVAFTTPEQDALRRDFTINGLFYDPHDDRVIDYVGGQEDLGRKVVRAIGEPRHRFSEDKLRMIRGVRIAATYAFHLEEQTAAAIRAMAEDVSTVSAERIGGELRRMLQDASRARAVELLHETRLLGVLLLEVETLFALPGEAARDTLRVLGALAAPSLALALAALLHRAGQGALADAVAERMRFSNKERQRAAWLLDHLGEIGQAPVMPWPRLQRLLIDRGAGELVDLFAAVHGPEHPAVRCCRERLALPPDQLNPPPLVTGDDLVRHGARPGRRFGPVLERVRDAQLEGRVTTHDEALKLAASLLAGEEPEH